MRAAVFRTSPNLLGLLSASCRATREEPNIRDTVGQTLSFELLFGKHRGATNVLVILPNTGSAFAEHLLAMNFNIYCSQILDMAASRCILGSLGVVFHWEN